MKITFFTSLLLIAALFSHAQQPTAKAASKIQPKIMVIPRVPDDVDMKKFYDEDMEIQMAIAKINEAFLNRGANLISFDQVLKQVKQNGMINKAANNPADIKAIVLQTSNADIYVEVKMKVAEHPGRGAKSVNLILDAYQTGTGNVLSSKTASGPMIQTEDIGQLTMLAIEKISEEFLNLMQLKFDDIVENGQSVFVQFTMSGNAERNFDSEINGKIFSELLEEWFVENAYKGVYYNQGVSSSQVTYSDVRIPLRNPKNPNANYTGQNLYYDISKYLKSIGVNSKREIGTSNKILITIL